MRSGLSPAASVITASKLPNGYSGFIKPAGGGKWMRVPSLAREPEDAFRRVWTTNWEHPPVFGCASYKMQAIPVMENEPTAEKCPGGRDCFLMPKGVMADFFVMTIPDKCLETADSGDKNHRIYDVTTKVFKTFGKTRLFYDVGFNLMNATILTARGKYSLVVKDEAKSPARKHLRLAVSDSVEEPCDPALSSDEVEDSSGIQIGDECHIYLDRHRNPRYYGEIKSTDMKRFHARCPFPKAFVRTRVSVCQGAGDRSEM